MIEDVRPWVDKLGAMSTVEVAEFLAQEGVTGIVGSAWQCPVAEFLKAKTGASHVCVGSRIHATDSNDRGPRVRTPATLLEFITNFDLGKYPELAESLYE